LPPLLDDIPIVYEDEDEDDMGESNPHTVIDDILRNGVRAHVGRRPGYRVFSNMNLYYRKKPLHRRTRSRPYVSPDMMIVAPCRDLGDNVSSYTIGEDGPAPVTTAEILSERSAQQRDKAEKLVIYAKLGVLEYIMVDWSGRWLPERLLLKRLQLDRRWQDEQDPDGGVTSQLGFRLIWDTDGWLRVLNAVTAEKYPRPEEAYTELRARREAEERVRALEAEIARLRIKGKPSQRRKKK